MIRTRPFLLYLLAVSCTVSLLINSAHVLHDADFPRFKTGSVHVILKQPAAVTLTVEGLIRDLQQPRVREGIYHGKIIDQTHRRVYNLIYVVVPHKTTVILIDNTRTAKTENPS